LLVVTALVLLFVSLISFNVKTVHGEMVCPTPKSVMLHSWYGNRMTGELIRELLNAGYQFYTYSQVYDFWDKGLCLPKNTVLVSLDDFYSTWSNLVLLDMISVFVEYDVVATLGVITRGESNSQNPSIWEYYKDLDKRGFERASHSSNHYNPYDLDEKGLRDEIIGSYEIICKYLGKCPKTYILPYGAGWDYDILLKIVEEKYRSVVSIAGPSTYSGQFFVMKRTVPGNGIPLETLRLMEVTFPWFETENETSRKVQWHRGNREKKILSGFKFFYE